MEASDAQNQLRICGNATFIERKKLPITACGAQCATHIALPSHQNASSIQLQCKLPVTDGEQQWQIDWDALKLLLLFNFCVST
jgi:hypothetical protein